MASNLKQEELFTLDDILHPRSEERRVFFNTGRDPLIKYLENAAERKNWGWVKLNEEQRTLAYSFDRSAAQCCGVRILAVDGSLDYPGMFHLDSESFTAALTPHNQEHLRNIQRGDCGLATYDNLRKLRTKSNLRLDDFVRQHGLYQLYKPLNGAVSKELQEFSFSIDVR